MCIEEILSIICMAVSSAIYSYSLQLKNKKTILIVQTISNVLYGLSYIFALWINESAKIGAITVAFEILRVIVYYIMDEKECSKKARLTAASVFAIALTTITVLSEPNWLCLLVLIGAIPVTFALANKSVLLIKATCFIQAIGITVYLFLLGLTINALTQIVVIVMGFIGLVTHLIKLNKEKKNKEKSTV